MAKRPRLTDADWATIRRALNDAMDERASYADAWQAGTPERAEALKQVKRFEDLHRKLFGDASARQQDIDRLASTPSVPIITLMRGGKE